MLCKYFPHERREVKVEEFINLKRDSMSVEEYSLNLSILSSYAPSFVSNPRDEMSRFLTGVADLVREECRTEMRHDDMTLSRLMVYAQLIKESKLGRITRNFKRSGSSDQGQLRFKKRAQTQEEPRSAKVKFERGGCSQNVKPTCVTCGKRHYGECLKGTESFFLLW